MKKFTDFFEAVTPVLGRLYELAKKYDFKNTTFLVKLGGVMLNGAQTGVFPIEILDPVRNLKARLNDQLKMREYPAELEAALQEYIALVVQYCEEVPEKTLNEEKCCLGLEMSLLLYKHNRLTYECLAAVFIDLEGEDDLGIELPDEVPVDEEHCLRHHIHDGKYLETETKEIEKVLKSRLGDA